MDKILKPTYFISALSLILFLHACSAQKKLDRLRTGETPSAQLSLGRQESFIPQIKNEKVSRDTLKIKDEDGTEILIMKAIKDEETGEMVAADVLDAAMVTARFRNIAERKGKVDLAFQVIVPASMRDSRWQLRFYPDMYVLEDSIRLEPVVITGQAYRKAQLKGYEHYDKFLSKIIHDTTAFINVRQLEIFLKRNIPQVYAFKTDSTYVSEEEFLSAYGVSERQAIDHYTNKFAKNMNERRKARKDKMYRKYVKAPIVTEGIRLDTVMVNSEGDFIYNYVQTLNTRPKLRRADIVLSGEIYEQEKKLYTIPRSEPLTFYISSIVAFVDNTERYLTKVVERRASANTECRIDFEVGKAEVRPELGENAASISRIEKTLASLLENETFDLDSVVVSATASPEGSYSFNGRLAQKRSEAVSGYFGRYMTHYADSLVDAAGISMDIEGNDMQYARSVSLIKLTPRCIPENWDDLHTLVEKDVVMNVDQKDDFFRHFKTKDPDSREAKMRSGDYYRYMKESL